MNSINVYSEFSSFFDMIISRETLEQLREIFL